MTRKDYQLIAGAINATRDSYAPNWDPNLFRALDDVSRGLAARMKAESPRFDEELFLAACGVSKA